MKFNSKNFFICALIIVLISVLLFSCFNKNIVEGAEIINYYLAAKTLDEAIGTYDGYFDSYYSKTKNYSKGGNKSLYDSNLKLLKGTPKFTKLQNACSNFTPDVYSCNNITYKNCLYNDTNKLCEIKIPQYQL
jgi:hypothetical protein